MKLYEAKQILEENNYMLLNETTAISASYTVLGMFVWEALEKYKDAVRAQIKEGVKLEMKTMLKLVNYG